MTTEQPAKPTLDEVVAFYIQIRDRKEVKERELKEAIAKYDAKLNELDTYILGELKALGVESVRTAAGTAYVSSKTRFNCTDWPTLHAWIMETGNVSVLQKRLSETTLKEFQQQQGAGQLPPAVQATVEQTANVRRPS
jgi:hypothetical protein